ncbi:hypothetical protein DOTSEDRAFT_72873 [Dothistroma septosporum NZE10]|uniref:Uncharacterized protein n=1 Tax=Dothistroma septosporum (strain NZE10 / CBS 128990) TaxID=675120 RepID=M2XMH4_DOTSN|nr:hypothetical protein DOTSEDRAFT_72873 [Dothistroma septosporum NZE10]
MADFRTSRPIEDFFVNPAFNFGTRRQQSNMVDDDTLYSGGADRFTHFWSTETRPTPSKGKAPATVTDLTDKSMTLHGYTSEEETASPIDDDSCSVTSAYSDSDNSDFTFPEALAESCNKVEQQCNRAQAVEIRLAGKAKVVSLPKLVDIPSRRGVVRPASIEHRRKSIQRRNSADHPQSARSSQDSHHGSDNSSVMDSPASTAPSSVIIEHSIELKRRSSIASRHVPLMEAARAISPTTPNFTYSTNSLIEPRSLNTTTREGILSSQRFNSTTSSLRLPLRRMNKLSLSSNFGLARIGKELRDTFVPKDAEAGIVNVAPQMPQAQARNASLSKTKMVARAANERAPMIELPPFPGGEEDDFASDWPLRMTSISNRVAAGA